MKKQYIIKSHDEFNSIINSGKRIKGNIITMYYFPYKYIIMLRKDCLSFSHEEWNKDMIDIIGKVKDNEKD